MSQDVLLKASPFRVGLITLDLATTDADAAAIAKTAYDALGLRESEPKVNQALVSGPQHDGTSSCLKISFWPSSRNGWIVVNIFRHGATVECQSGGQRIYCTWQSAITAARAAVADEDWVAAGEAARAESPDRTSSADVS